MKRKKIKENTRTQKQTTYNNNKKNNSKQKKTKTIKSNQKDTQHNMKQ